MDNKQMAILGMILSFIVAPAGIIVSAIALNKLKQSGQEDGKGFAIAGIVIGGVEVLIAIISIACSVCILGAGLAGMGSY